MKVFLDDRKQPNDVYNGSDWVLVRTVEEVIDLLKTGEVTHLSLDNDLGEKYTEGHRVVTWMIEHNIWPSKEAWVHSENSVRAATMIADIERHFYDRKSDE